MRFQNLWAKMILQIISLKRDNLVFSLHFWSLLIPWNYFFANSHKKTYSFCCIKFVELKRFVKTVFDYELYFVQVTKCQ